MEVYFEDCKSDPRVKELLMSGETSFDFGFGMDEYKIGKTFYLITAFWVTTRVNQTGGQVTLELVASNSDRNALYILKSEHSFLVDEEVAGKYGLDYLIDVK